jgi:hypothetical protein
VIPLPAGTTDMMKKAVSGLLRKYKGFHWRAADKYFIVYKANKCRNLYHGD